MKLGNLDAVVEYGKLRSHPSLIVGIKDADKFEAFIVGQLLQSHVWAYHKFSKKILEKCGSEIEKQFASAFIAVGSLYSCGVCFENETVGDYFDTVLRITPQFPVGKYRADFALEMFSVREGKETQATSLIVECDGHDYHERTKEQAQHDKARDRYFIEQGLKVFRFTGSEIFSNSLDCAMQAYDLLNETESKS